MNLPIQIKVILAGMLSLMPPGKSVYSRIAIDNCDAVCQSKNICEAPGVLCAAPTFSQIIFDEKMDNAIKNGMNDSELEVFEEIARNASYTRAENYEEGLTRYVTIAQAIYETSQEMAWVNTDKDCKAKCTNPALYSDSADCRECSKQHPWMGSVRELQGALLTVMYGESGFRRDIHSGQGTLARGDCKWQNRLTGKPVPPNSKGGIPVPGSCRSVCLAQINIGSDVKYGFKADDLVGLDLQSTKNCAKVATYALSATRKLCSGPLSDYRGDWAKGMFSAYGTGGSCKAFVGTGESLREAPWPATRAGWFWNFMKHPKTLDESVVTTLSSL